MVKEASFPVRNRNKNEQKESSKILAKGLEEKAFANAKKSNIKDPIKDIGKLYEKAGDLRKKAGDIAGAEIAYTNAIRKGYVYSVDDKERTEEKIEGLKYNRFRASKKFGLEKKTFLAFLSISFLVVALLSSVYSITGYSIAGLGEENFRFVGTGFFLLGLFFAFFYFRCKKGSK